MSIPRQDTAALGAALGLILFAAGVPAAAAAPDWVMNGSLADESSLFAVGLGPSRVEAVADALGQLARLKSPRPKKPSAKQEVKARFGPISVSRNTETELAGQDRQAGESRRQSAAVAWEAGKDSLHLAVEARTVERPGSRGMRTAEYEFKAQGLSFAGLLKELERQGIQVLTYDDSGDFTRYVGLRLPLAKGQAAAPQAPAAGTQPPAWASRKDGLADGRLWAMGRGRSRAQALAFALGALAVQKSALAKGGPDGKPLTEGKFGPISVSHYIDAAMTSDPIRPAAGGEDEERFLEDVADEAWWGKDADMAGWSRDSIQLKSGKDSLSFSVRYKDIQSSARNLERSSTELEYRGLTLDSLLEELARQGISVSTYVDPREDEVSVGLGMKAPQG